MTGLYRKSLIRRLNSPLQRQHRQRQRARTPFDRLCETGVLSPSQQQRLTALLKRTNPRQLRREIHDLIEQILALPGAGADETEDIFNTLLTTKEGGFPPKAVPL